MTVVGAGPVGLVLAAELALSGATVQVLERRAEPDEAMKAQSINVPTAEALDRRGLLPAAERCSGGARAGGIVRRHDRRDGRDPTRSPGTSPEWSSTPTSWTGPIPTSPRTPRPTERGWCRS